MLYCVRLCVRFLFLRKIFARKEERMGIKGRANREERKNESGGKEEQIGRKGRTDREKGASTSGGTRKYQRWYTKVPPLVFSLVLPRIQEKTASSAREDYIVCRRTLRRLPENTTSSTGEHLFDSPHPTLIGLTPFRLERRAIGQKSYAETGILRRILRIRTHCLSMNKIPNA